MRALISAVLWPLILIVAISAALLPIMFLGRTDVARSVVEPRDAGLLPIDRMAEIALYRLGHYRLLDTNYDEDDRAGRRRELVPVSGGSLLSDCAPHPAVAGIVGAEAYVRPAWRRDLELALARSWLALSGRLPDWSFGIAQIRLSTARAALDDARDRATPLLGETPVLSDPQLLALLSDPCEAMAAAGLIADPTLVFDGPVEDLATRFRGGAGPADLPGVVSYEALAARIAAEFDELTYRPDDLGASERSDLFMEPPAPGFQSLLCFERYYEGLPFTLARILLPPDPVREVRIYDLRFDPESVRNRLRNIPAERTTLQVRYRTAGYEPGDYPLRRFEATGDHPSQPFGALVDALSLLGGLERIGLGAERGWKAITLDPVRFDPRTTEGPWPCMIEVAISPPVPGLYEGLAPRPDGN